DPPEEDIVHITNWLQSRLKSIENYFFVQYLFSLLIESDKLDASNTATYSLKPINEIAVDNYLKKLSTDNEIDDKRNEVKRKILSCLDNIDVANQSLFTLTAPTGIGKTLASLNFVLHLKEKCKNQNGQEPLIVYTLPFINIIEQTVKEFEKVFKNDDVKIVKHHQYTDLYDKNEKISINNLIMQLETWQGDLIVTTFVQLFQTIIGNRNSLLKKFHRLANSIIILDEIQNIDVKYWPLIGSVLYYLTKFLKSKIILMTATQPFLFETAKQHILTNENINITPLLPDYQKYFKALQRTKLIPLIDEKLNDENDFFELFNKHWNPSKSALIVVNTIARSLAVYNLLEEQFPDTTIFYLSTNIIPRCRQVVIYQIRKALKRKEKIILVSTQCVEAGVDLDFNMGFRDLAPLDSIIQVAGRVNRNNKIPEPCPVYIFEFEKDASLVYGAILPSRSKMVLQEINKQEIYENNFLDLIQKYFSLIVSQDGKSMEPSKEIFTAMEKLRFTKLDNETEKSVSDFQLIESRYGYVDVFVCLNRKSERILSHFQNRYLNEEDNSKKRIEYLKIKKGFNSHIISIPKNKLGGLKSFQLLDNLNYIPLNQLEQYYKLDSGFIRSSEDHSMIF
ncbi:CRISPR-associated helicase Cas3', partial [candidate division KSB1 bacterium]|nr:CRISPR-associated helicase Cas3' [candidate division KSB1 bacterium]